MTRAEALLIQQELAKKGFIFGTDHAVAALLGGIFYADNRFRKIGAEYGPTARPKPGKEPGTPYEMLITGRGPVKGVRTDEEQARRTVPNALLTAYCVGSERRAKGDRAWRHIMTNTIRWVEVYTGRKVVLQSKHRKGQLVGERVRIPVFVTN